MRIALGGLLVGLAVTAWFATARAAEPSPTQMRAAGLAPPVADHKPVPAPTSTATPVATPVATWSPSLRVEGSARFYDGDFVYIAPPPQQPLSPIFHGDKFLLTNAEDGHSRLVRDQAYGLVPLPTARTPRAQAPTALGGAPVTPVAKPSPTAVVATATPAAAVSSHAAQATVASTPASALAATQTPARPVLASPVGTTPAPAATPTVAWATHGGESSVYHPAEDPRFYHGSFVYDAESNRLRPLEKALCCFNSAHPAAVSTPVQPAQVYRPLSPNRGARSVLPIGGKAMYYNPGIMAQVLSYRLALGQVTPCSDCVGYVALMHSGDLNRKVWLQWAGGEVEGPFLVIDVAATQHVPWLLARQWVVDVDYATAMRHAMNGPLPVTVLDGAPRAPVSPGNLILTNGAQFEP